MTRRHRGRTSWRRLCCGRLDGRSDDTAGGSDDAVSLTQQEGRLVRIGLARRVLSDDLMMPAKSLMSHCCTGRDGANPLRSVRLSVDFGRVT